MSFIDADQDWEDEIKKLRADLDAERRTYRCFHCGFETSDPKDAKAHFGDRDDESPLCVTWKDLDADGRASEYASALGELASERDENGLLRTQIEGLEYRVEGQLSEIRGFKPFRGCTSIQEIFNLYDSMEGRALLAEEQLATQRAARESLEKERDGLAAVLARVDDVIENWPNGDLDEDAAAMAKVEEILRGSRHATILAAHDARLTAPLERRVGEQAELLASLTPLLDVRPDFTEVMVPGLAGGEAVCLSCGAQDDMIMILDHRDNCKAKAQWKALEALRAALASTPREGQREPEKQV